MSKKKRKKIFNFLILILLLFLMSPVSSFLIQRMEKMNPVLNEIAEYTPVILFLGSGGVPAEGLSPYQRLDDTALHRTLEGIRLWKLHPHSLLIFSSRAREGYVSQASLYADVVLELA